MARETITPQQKLPKLIVVVAFDADEEGEMQPVFGPAEQVSEDRAIRTAKQLAQKHAAVVAWSRRPSGNMVSRPCCSPTGRCRTWSD